MKYTSALQLPAVVTSIGFTDKAKKYLALGVLSLLPMTVLAAPQKNAWKSMAQADADFVSEWMTQESIMAVYPSREVFSARLTGARRDFDAESAGINTYEGYRQALNHFVGSFQDQHLWLSFSLSEKTYQWPGFFAVYQGHRYLTSSSKAGILDGIEITECDGKPMADWVRMIATYEQMSFNLESTNAEAAALIFRDTGSTFIQRPKQCKIGGKDVELDWSPIPSSKFTSNVSNTTTIHDRTTATTPFGSDGSWVRMGIFQPVTQEEGRAFKKLFDNAESLRNKSVIILDVRGNGGGPYNWFMGFLKALYGTEYVNYYARARLEISNVIRTTPEILDFFNSNVASEVDSLLPPPDGAPYDNDNLKYHKALESGNSVFVIPKNYQQIAMPKNAPTSPVKAKVYVLTDYGCASACIGFVDEMKRFPGVKQIGVETFIDSRTGTPFGAPLPSGNGSVSVPVMTRDGRERGDNVPQRPDYVFSGNIADTQAVKAWIQSDILGKTGM